MNRAIVLVALLVATPASAGLLDPFYCKLYPSKCRPAPIAEVPAPPVIVAPAPPPAPVAVPVPTPAPSAAKRKVKNHKKGKR